MSDWLEIRYTSNSTANTISNWAGTTTAFRPNRSDNAPAGIAKNITGIDRQVWTKPTISGRPSISTIIQVMATHWIIQPIPAKNVESQYQQKARFSSSDLVVFK